jgi:hypothetical protein
MLNEKNVLLPLVEKFVDDGCSFMPEGDLMKLKSYLKKDENSCYTIYDKEHSIKCIFDTEFLHNYLDDQASHMKLENFDSKIHKLILASMILIKKYYFDVLFVKNVNKTISIRAVLYIQDFEVDIAQRAKDRNITKKNINCNPVIAEKLKNFYFNFSKV